MTTYPAIEPDAYRWRQKGSQLWIYDPTPKWLEEHRHEVDVEPLYGSNVVGELRSQLAEWQQAASVEAGLRREFLARAGKAEAEADDALKQLVRGEILWCCHVRGPDDVYAAPDYATALAWSDATNEINWRANSNLNIGNPKSFQECLIKAVPSPWPHSPESHAENLPISIAGFTAPDCTQTDEQGSSK